MKRYKVTARNFLRTKTKSFNSKKEAMIYADRIAGSGLVSRSNV